MKANPIFRKIYLFYFTYLAAGYFCSTLLVLWLSKNGFGFSDLIFYYLLTFLVALLGILYIPKKNLTSRKAIFWGVIFNLGYVLILVKIFHPYQLYLSALVSGLNVVYFWTVYNIMYFKYSSEENRGINSSMYYLITPIIGITLQPIAGIVAQKFGFTTMFTIGLSLYLVPLFLVKYLPDFKLEYNVKKELSALRFNWTLFFQGMTSRINYSLVAIYTLFFIKSPSSFGNFFGYLALVTVFASLINGYISDKFKNRKYFFYLFSIVSVISFLPLAFVTNPYYWSLFAGISSLCFYLVSPFWFTYSLDTYKEIGVEKTMILREIHLNLGYFFNLLIVLLVFYFTKSTKISLIVISLVCCMMPLVSYLSGVYRDKI